jgi:hypothetical protein
VQKRIELINQIEMQAMEDDQVWADRKKQNPFEYKQQSNLPIHQRLIEAKLGSSHGEFEDGHKKQVKKKKTRNG